MAFANYSDYVTAVEQARREFWTKATQAGTTGRLHSLAKTTPNVMTTPITAAAVDRTLVGCIGQQNSSTVLRLVRMVLGTGEACSLAVVDRLSHQGGLDGTSSSAQTTNLPTAALTRYTSGVSVMAGLEIYSAVGGTPQTATASYTNSGSTSGRTAPACVFGGTGFTAAARFIPLNLQSGDVGIKSVESVTLSGSTGTVGNFGVTLYRRLTPFLAIAPYMPDTHIYDAVQHLGGFMPRVLDDACLFLWMIATSSTGTSGSNIDLILAEE